MRVHVAIAILADLAHPPITIAVEQRGLGVVIPAVPPVACRICAIEKAAQATGAGGLVASAKCAHASGASDRFSTVLVEALAALALRVVASLFVQVARELLLRDTVGGRDGQHRHQRGCE